MSEKSNMSRRSFLRATGGAATGAALTGTAAGQETTTQQGGDGGGQETTTQQGGDGGGQETTTGGGGAQAGGGTFNLINTGTVSTLDPIRSTDTAGGRVIQNVFDGLMNYPNGEIEVEPLLATGYETSDDFTTYTFDLKEGAQFHGDYGEVTAQDFIYAWERLAASDQSRRAYFILDSLGVVHETTTETTQEGEQQEVYQPGSLAVEAVDDYTIEVTLAEPFHATLEMLAYTAFAAVPEGVVGDIEGYDGDLDYRVFSQENPVGAGPFVFEVWSPNDEIEVSRFEDYHGNVASVETVNWRIIEDDNAIYTYAMNRNADAFPIPTAFYNPANVNVENTDDLGREFGTYGPIRNGATVDYLSVPTINAFYIGFNTAQVEKPARQAAAYAMNQQQVIEQIFKSRGVAAYHFTPPSIYPGGPDQYTQHAEQNYPYGYNQTQLDQARQVMEEAGYGPDDQYEFTFTIYQGSSTWQQVAQLLRDQLASAHISMNVESAPFSTLLQRGRQGNLQSYSLGWIMDWPAPDNFLQLLYPPQTDTSQAAPLSYVNWSNTEAAQQAIEAWEQVQNNTAPTDEAEQARNDAYVTIEEANWEDVVFLPVYHESDQLFWYDNVEMEPFGSGGFSRMKFNGVELTE